MPRVELGPQDWIIQPGLAGVVYRRMSNQGILVVAFDENKKPNPMTIGWGTFGYIWSRPVFTILVRPSRYTNSCIEVTGDFTINVLPDNMRDVLAHCGTESGRDVDKMDANKLIEFKSTIISSPGIDQADIVFECKSVASNDLFKQGIDDCINEHYYPADDYHRLYYGEILNVSVEKGFLDNLKT